MTSPNDVAALVERGADAMEALVHVAGTLGREGDKDSEDTIKDLAGILAATIAALQAEVERAKEEAYEAAAQVALNSRCDTSGDRRRAETIAGGIRLLASAARSAARKENTP